MRISLKKSFGEGAGKVNAALWFLGKHAFAATLLFVLGAGLIAALLFWQYVIFTPQVAQEGVVSEHAFLQQAFEELLLQLDQEAARVKEADLRTPRDLFNP